MSDIDGLAVAAELDALLRQLSRRTRIRRMAPGLYRLRLYEQGREVRRIYRPTRRQCARLGLAWLDGEAVPRG